MTQQTDKLVVLMTKGIDSELSSVAFTIAMAASAQASKYPCF